jgi:hypothetical protein
MTVQQDTAARLDIAREDTARRATGGDGSTLDLDALQAALRAADPNVLLAPPWLLQAVIASDRGLLPTALNVPDDQLYTVDRATFLRFIEDQELPAPAGGLPPGPDLILLERPDAEWLATTPADQVLTRYWRLLTRAVAEARVRRALPDPRAGAAADAVRAAVARRVARVGAGAFNEARHVLVRERRLGAADSDLDAYAKFAAAFTDLWHFAPRVIAHVFPSVKDPSAVARAVEADVGNGLSGAGVAESVRPPGVPDAAGEGVQPMEPPYARRTWWALARRWLWPARPRGSVPAAVRPTTKARRETLLVAAERAASLRNDVRAAVLTARAHWSADDDWRVAPGQAGREVDRLADRLAAALEFDAGERAEWRTALRGLLGPAAVGWKSPESRLLYDLQKVCDDREREIYSVNVVEWALERGRRPLFRALPNQRLALAARHLQSAVERLPRCRLTAPQRGRLDGLLHHALHDADHRLRDALAPGIVAAFTSAGLVPRTAVETVGRDKMVQELLDVILRDGFLTFAGVRDAVSRNVLRCRDLSTPGEWAGYDQLMSLDRRLGDALDGVYRRGEIYRYLFQKFSSLLFAWPAGRLLTKTVVLPLIAAYILLSAVDHMVVEKIWRHRAHWAHLTNPQYMLPAAGVLFLLINWPALRQSVGRAVAWCLRWLSFALFDVPGRLLKNRALLALVTSRPMRMSFRYGFKPLTVVLLAWWLLPSDVAPAVQGVTFAAAFLATNLVVNSRTGRAFEQAVLHALRVGWVRFTADVLTHALRGVVRLFARLVETVDRMLYAVDEWLRFRAGQPHGSLVGKAVLGVFWFYIAYVARFVINLLVEPQINPIKHFPVVTVSHKLLLPMIPSLAGGLEALKVCSRGEAAWLAGAIMTSVPGVFGFLAWELKENWKLYRANLPDELKPIHFGSHGESVAQLLRPGFHSGTLPKAYAKVRRAHRNYDPDQAAADPTEYPLAVRKHLTTIHHVEESLSAFVGRAFLPLVNRHALFRRTPVDLSAVEVGVTQIGLLLGCPGRGLVPMRVEFRQVAGWIVGDVTDAGWSAGLTGPDAELLAFALLGLFKMSAVDVARADVDAAFAGLGVEWELRPKHLVVRPATSAVVVPGDARTNGRPAGSADEGDRPAAGADYAAGAEYALYERVLRPRGRHGVLDPTLPVLRPEQVLLREQPVRWQDWVQTWEADGGEPLGFAVVTAGHAAPAGAVGPDAL